ncbi:MAG TPA: cytochrome c peroxidase [Planctomycetota bacterium]|nr:cytochrome c peroxidase [Planctomycetota bacterium]
MRAQGPGPLPPPPAPPENPVTAAKAVLGKMLFWEEQLSSSNRVACGTCHRPANGGSDPRRVPNPGADGVLPSPDDTFGSPGQRKSDASNDYTPSPAFGFNPQVTGRSSPSNLMGAYAPLLFWDGRASSRFTDPVSGQVAIVAGGALESQSVGPPVSDVEMAHDARNWNEITGKLAGAKPMALATNLPPDVVTALQQRPDYPALFQFAFGSPGISAQRIAFALASYQRTLVADQTPWDNFRRGQLAALTPNQVAGMNLFNGPARCNLCHVPGLFTDQLFHNLGLRPIAEDRGRQNVTNNPADRGRFKVPSLRNAGLKSLFMHTGQFPNLGAVLGFYNGGAGPNLDNKDPLLQPLGLPPLALQQLLDFVANGLTDPRVRNQLAPFDRPTLWSERNPPNGQLFGLGSAGTGGRVPAMLADLPGNLGNPDFKVGVANGRGAAPAVLVVALQQAPAGSQINGVPVLVDVWVTGSLVPATLGGTPGAAGAGFATVRQAVPADPVLSGLVLFAQWFVFDAGVVPGAAATNGAQLQLF